MAFRVFQLLRVALGAMSVGLPMYSLKRCLMGVAMALAGILLAGAIALYYAASWLLSPQAPEAADAIVVLAGDLRRARYAGDLYRQGFAPQVLLSRPARDAREKMLDEMGIVFPKAEAINMAVLQASGVPPQHVTVFGSGSLSTFDEAAHLSRIFAGKSPRLLIVTSPYHVRRARKIFSDAMPGANLLVVATPYEDFPARWWTSQDAARDLLLELAKLSFYLVGGRFVASEK
jgi:uncharacterized SAM-binding protein YcdF (DUF218 family)